MAIDRLQSAARWVLLLLGALIAGMIVVGYLILQAFSAGIESRDQAVLSSERTMQIRRILLSAINAETGQRGYLLTGDPAYLEPHTAANRNYDAAVKAYYEAKDGELNALQADLLPQLTSLLDKKFAELNLTVDQTKRGDRDAAMAMVRTDIGLNLLAEARDVAAELEAEEVRILHNAIARAESTEQRARALLLFLGLAALAVVPGMIYLFWRAMRSERAERSLALTRAAKAQTDLLAHELNHRVKNLFTIVLSLVRQSGRTTPEHAAACEVIHDRIHALSLAHAAALRSEKDNSPVKLNDLIVVLLEPYAMGQNVYEIEGADIALAPAVVTPLSLIIHELATNAVKYGAWSTDQAGVVRTLWHTEHDAETATERIVLSWEEIGGPETDAAHIGKDGFGSRMINLSCRQINGEPSSEWLSGGLHFRLSFDNNF
ncbi:sensor histidine kinase [Hyphomonas oceanitis]|uniref:histidine kinase n=1 Tax=Hyphomonas oceanitis SCH89 TaxID=1280953 RepID=A0A059GAQ3_9PROT|nr:CHASE3 domain-containing protein [Hyphomonas oceanitis]KDA03563.1 signal transduction histidine kinase [Hyphomonas oceanitis SCH89]